MQKEKRKPSVMSRRVAENRIKMLADRCAILLTICNARDGDDWNPWMGEGMYEGEGQLGDELRKMKDYKVAKDIVRLWVQKQDKRTVQEVESE